MKKPRNLALLFSITFLLLDQLSKYLFYNQEF